MNKRTGFVVVSLVLAFCLWVVQFFNVDLRLTLVLVLTLVSYVLAAWVLFEDMKGIEWIMLLILPVMFTLGSGLFSYYLPTAIPNLAGVKFGIETAIFLAGVVRFLFFVIYGAGMYAILLTENIFSVASIRTIQLLRAARSVGFIFCLVVGLFFFHTFFCLRLPFYFMGLMVMAVSFVLSLSSLWSVELKMAGLGEVLINSLLISWLMAQTGAVMSFWPVEPLMGALILIAGFYCLLGLFQQRMANRMYMGGVAEYVVFLLIVLITGFLTTSWRG